MKRFRRWCFRGQSHEILVEGFSRSGIGRGDEALEMIWLKRTLRARIEGMDVKLAEFPDRSV